MAVGFFSLYPLNGPSFLFLAYSFFFIEEFECLSWISKLNIFILDSVFVITHGSGDKESLILNQLMCVQEVVAQFIYVTYYLKWVTTSWTYNT